MNIKHINTYPCWVATILKGVWISISLEHNLFDSLTPEKCRWNLELVIFKFIPRIRDALSISCEIAIMWLPQDLTDD